MSLNGVAPFIVDLAHVARGAASVLRCQITVISSNSWFPWTSFLMSKTSPVVVSEHSAAGVGVHSGNKPPVVATATTDATNITTHTEQEQDNDASRMKMAKSSVATTQEETVVNLSPVPTQTSTLAAPHHITTNTATTADAACSILSTTTAGSIAGTMNNENTLVSLNDSVSSHDHYEYPDQKQKQTQLFTSKPHPSSFHDIADLKISTSQVVNHSPKYPDSSTVAANSIPSPTNKRLWNERKVPQSSFARAVSFGALGLNLLTNMASESASRYLSRTQNDTTPGNPHHQHRQQENHLISEKNAHAIASTLSRMRGAALKLGQMLSIQDDRIVPVHLLKALERVRHAADIMPQSQLFQTLDQELGTDWHEKVAHFEKEPLAAASIGQVHKAVLHDGTQVVMKIQYPGVAKSIDSDINSLKRLSKYTGIFPKQIYIDKVLASAKEELTAECNYIKEAQNQIRYKELLEKENKPHLQVPTVVESLSSERVLTSHWVSGVPIDQLENHPQSIRDRVASLILEITLMELFNFGFMQTDPNFSNFLYDDEKDCLSLIDFGAARAYRPSFIDDYVRMIVACADRDADAILDRSRRLGFLTGDENQVMIQAHLNASYVVGEPFSDRPDIFDDNGAYDFYEKKISQRTAAFGKEIMENRLCPPPQEAYSLHRRLSGAFLICMRLKSKIKCRQMLFHYFDQYKQRQSTLQGSLSQVVHTIDKSGVNLEKIDASLA